jgi:CheY-like chemotaxis protein
MAVRCVVVDDNARFLEAARDTLERDGIAVVGVATSSDEAVSRVGELHPDVALIDVCLGEENGFALAELIAGEGAIRPPSVIMVSTYAEWDFDGMTEVSAACAFLSKCDLSGRAVHEILTGAVPCSGGAVNWAATPPGAA